MIGIIGLRGRGYGKGPHRFPTLVIDDEDSFFDDRPPVRVSIDQTEASKEAMVFDASPH